MTVVAERAALRGLALRRLNERGAAGTRMRLPYDLKEIDMARNGKITADAHAAQDAPAPAAEPGVHPLEGSAVAARTIMSSSLTTAQNMVEWATQIQRQQAKALGSWSHALDSALREAEHAADLPSLISVATRLTQRQLDLGTQQLAEGAALWMESELQWANRLRGDTAALLHQMMPSAAPVPLAAANASDAHDANGADASPLAQLGRIQDQWLATTQRWIAAAGASANH
jgi:hypothetical protein